MWFGIVGEESVWIPVSCDRVQEIIDLNKKGIIPESFEDLNPDKPVAEKLSLSELNSDLERMDKKYGSTKIRAPIKTEDVGTTATIGLVVQSRISKQDLNQMRKALQRPEDRLLKPQDPQQIQIRLIQTQEMQAIRMQMEQRRNHTRKIQEKVQTKTSWKWTTNTAKRLNYLG